MTHSLNHPLTALLLTKLKKVVDHGLLVAPAGRMHTGDNIPVEIGEHLDKLLELCIRQSRRPLRLLLLFLTLTAWLRLGGVRHRPSACGHVGDRPGLLRQGRPGGDGRQAEDDVDHALLALALGARQG